MDSMSLASMSAMEFLVRTPSTMMIGVAVADSEICRATEADRRRGAGVSASDVDLRAGNLAGERRNRRAGRHLLQLLFSDRCDRDRELLLRRRRADARDDDFLEAERICLEYEVDRLASRRETNGAADRRHADEANVHVAGCPLALSSGTVRE